MYNTVFEGAVNLLMKTFLKLFSLGVKFVVAKT